MVARRSSVLPDGSHSSIIAFENGAMLTNSMRSSIGGRLGGSIRGASPNMTAAELAALYDMDAEKATEKTPLTHDNNKPSPGDPAPPLLIWIFPALACAAAYALYNIFIKKGSYSIHPILGGVILQFVAALVGTILLGGIIVQEGDNAKQAIEYDKDGLFWSCCAGLAVGTAEMLSFCVSGMGVAATQSIPIIIGGSVVVGAVLGLLLLGEKMMFHGWSGIGMLVAGIGMVATDPGEKAEEGGGGGDVEAAPLFIWIFPALACASCYALYNIFIKKGSSSINPILGGVVLQFVAAIFGSLLLGGICINEGGVQNLNWDYSGLLWACCAGVAVGAAELLSFCVSGLGVPATQSIPTIIGGSVGVGAVLGLVMLGETLMLQGWGGVLLLIIGIGFVATDPGEKVAGH